MPSLPHSMYEKILQSIRGRGGGKAPRGSASVVPWRGEGRELEVFWVRRAATMPFMGGWFAFPGGGVAKRDLELEVAAPPAGADHGSYTPPLPGAEAEGDRLGPDLVPGLLAGALRELFEETGLLLTAGPARPDAEALSRHRRRLLAKEVSLAGILAETGWRLSAERLRFAGRWLTPPLAPLRFDNRFFLLAWRRGEDPPLAVDGRELDLGEWIRPAEALERWRRGSVLTAPPILHLLRVLAEEGPADGLGRLVATAEADLGPVRRIEFRPGVIQVPLRTPTLPPAEHTNAFLVGHGESVLVDPGSPFPEEIETLTAALEAARERHGREVTAIWLTHHHPDHVGGVEAMRRRLGVPVLAHRESVAPLAARGIEAGGELEDGRRIRLAGESPLTVRVLHTPGHTRGHLSFLIEEHETLITGDLIAGFGTIVIDPPEGDMDAYLRSLERMDALSPGLLLPSHGPPLAREAGTLRRYIEHRLERESQVLAAWREGHREPAALVARVYRDTPEALHPIARRQAEAHLLRLEKLGEIER